MNIDNINQRLLDIKSIEACIDKIIRLRDTQFSNIFEYVTIHSKIYYIF
jgi:hypothetical protein